MGQGEDANTDIPRDVFRHQWGEKELTGAEGGIWGGESSSPCLLPKDAGTPHLPGPRVGGGVLCFGVFSAEPSVIEQCRGRGGCASGNHRFGEES